MQTAQTLILILLTALFGGVTAKKLNLPLIAGYAIGGALVGFLLPLKNLPTLSNICEISVALLMFSLGLKFPLESLKRVGSGLFGAIFQILAFLIFGLFIFPAVLHLSFYESLFLASVASLSSMVLPVKILGDQGRLFSLSGEVTTAFLIVQALILLPMVVFLSALGDIHGSLIFNLGKALFSVFAIFYLTLLLGKRTIPYIFKKLAYFSSGEMLRLFALFFALGFAIITYKFGLPIALGAYLSGIILSFNPAFNFEILGKKPLRDIFALIFFTSLGMLISPKFFISHLSSIIFLSFFVFTLKFLSFAVLLSYLSYHSKISFLVGTCLCGVGEWAFVLALFGFEGGLSSAYLYQLSLSLILFSAIVTPFIISFAPGLYYQLQKVSAKYAPKFYHFIKQFDKRAILGEEKAPLEGHVILVGYGKIGRVLEKILRYINRPFIVIDYDLKALRELRMRGIPFLVGDPLDPETLKRANVEKAEALVITLPDLFSSQLIISKARRINPNIKIVAWATNSKDKELLKERGIGNVLESGFEVSLSIAHRLLALLGVENSQILSLLKELRKEFPHG